MARHSQHSANELSTAHPELQLLFKKVLEYFDHTILKGHRNEAEQNKAYEEGKSQKKFPESNHNKLPSLAVDAMPFPIDWKDRERMTYFAGVVKGIAKILKEQGKMKHDIRWGGDWNSDTHVKDNKFDDLVHFELVP